VPTLYIWGDADDTVGRIAAEGTKDFIAAPYRFEVLPGVGHFAADQAPGSDQAQRSRHHRAFLEPGAADIVLADDARWLRERWTAAGVPKAAMEKHLAVLGNKGAMEAALAWYRARGAIRSPLGPIRVPTLYIWGDDDDTVGRPAAEGTVDFVAASYRFEVLSGGGHFVADQMPDAVTRLMLEHVKAYPA
jgi:pimeloyl-ACP methyl ester carboxylesterase